MTWRVVFAPRALKELKKLDRATAAMLLGWVRKNLEGCENPRSHGKGLSGPRGGQWRYRVGDYRLIAEIADQEIVILILVVGHRSSIYSN